MVGVSRLVKLPAGSFFLAPCFLSKRTFRSYSAAAAAVEYDYDYNGYDDDDEDTVFEVRGGDRRRRQIVEGLEAMPMVDCEGSEPSRGVQWVIMGEPGAKKHLYAQWLSKLLEVPHISMGTLVRQELHPTSSLYKQIKDAVNQGKLVPVDVIFGLLSKRLEEGYSRGENGFILDGIPRTRTQAEILDEITDIDMVLNLKCSDNCFVKGQFGSGLNLHSPSCRIRSYNSNKAAWNEKLRAYADQSKPLEEYYKRQKKLLNFRVAAAPGETWNGLLAALRLQHMSYPTSSQKLTA